MTYFYVAYCKPNFISCGFPCRISKDVANANQTV